MNTQSNLTIASNIYVRNKDHFMDDHAYLLRITGKGFLNELKKRGHDLSAAQKRIMLDTCAYSKRYKDNEVSFGLVMRDGYIIEECRCEAVRCSNFKNCMMNSSFKTFKRQNITEASVEQEDVIENYEYLGINLEEAEEIIVEPSSNTTPSIALEETHEVEYDDTVELSLINNEEYIKTEDTKAIIEGSIDSHVLVNAGPGTGKTYTVMQRVLYLLKNDFIEPDEILVLCYTRAAKKVIEDRVEEGVKNKTLPVYAKNINICTLDSMATQYLLAKGADIEELNYNNRIKKFNELFDSDDFEEYRYIIVDEMQDLVNERARMVLNLVKKLNSGWLLLGDKCQAIYDYDCENAEDTINSIEFYKKLEEHLPDDVARYEIIGNKRQCEHLMELSDSMREVLLNGDPKEHCKYVFDKLNHIDKVEGKISERADRINIKFNDNERTAILCRTNGEAEKISSLLHSKNISHKLLRGVGQNPQLNRWVADVLWDFCEEYIGKHEFVERYTSRVEDDLRSATEKFLSLLDLCNKDENSTTLSMKEMRAKLYNTTSLPDIFLENENSNLYISTIHHAKGNEFDRVYIVYNEDERNNCLPEEARVYYVAVTRAKKELYIIGRPKSGWNFKRNDSGRCSEYSFHYNNTHCTNLVVGLNGDINPQSFVDGYHEKAVAKQAYIAHNIKKNDGIILQNNNPNDNKNPIYKVIHNNNIIGEISFDAINDFWQAIKRFSYKKNLPLQLTDLYVEDIVAFVPRDNRFPLHGQFKDSRIFLGVKVTGFAKCKFN